MVLCFVTSLANQRMLSFRVHSIAATLTFPRPCGTMMCNLSCTFLQLKL